MADAIVSRDDQQVVADRADRRGSCAVSCVDEAPIGAYYRKSWSGVNHPPSVNKRYCYV